MNAATATLAAVADSRRVQGRSRHAQRLHADLMAVSPEIRGGFLASLTRADLAQVFAVAQQEAGTPYSLWVDDPVGFTERVLGETLWSKPREILSAVPRHKRVAVPSCFSSGKTWTLGRATLWWGLVNPVGTAQVVTIAPLWRQVQRLIWREIRYAHSRAGLPGSCDTTQWKLRDYNGMETVVAYGLSAPPHNEAAVQGIHAARLLVIVDEAGGIGRVIGRNLRGVMTGEDTRAIVTGNPPTDDEGSWFESLCAEDDVKVIPIPTRSTPNFSGEVTPPCRSCPPEVPRHFPGKHLVERQWLRETIAEAGEDSAYYIAKVLAEFPRGVGDRAIPSTWVDLAVRCDEPDPVDDDRYVRLDELGLPGETDGWVVKRGAWVRLGVDVAADGGDELAVARIVGNLVTEQFAQAGAANANAVDVAGRVLEEIRRAEALREALGTVQKVRVKIDGIGVGWGVASILQAWGSEGLHDAEIVVVIVSERPADDDEAATFRPANKRAEMWLAFRSQLAPPADGEAGGLRLRISHKTALQLSAPGKNTTTAGRMQIESKAHLKARGVSSPDRAEAVILAVYEPVLPRRRSRLVTRGTD